ncbi:hypothetical protein T310_3102 [Rasamsonia emersonii CBS 393.64]|uniref:Uncharacterized protein n=1 Tax=Rasamsonia emersonii (strain ATCC 16479 / CBS 393.64 / IMI 116815) TaxID=1408163 RepID=A0A0F4YXS1_RASE3|nr:hypothetical protein T310_3102 [Rasamsonia emersonii CBS 393.64]KKA22885.1 hypothetical protein T310_3102 [Rasamsonia emersonii CBS 393.64]
MEFNYYNTTVIGTVHVRKVMLLVPGPGANSDRASQNRELLISELLGKQTMLLPWQVLSSSSSAYILFSAQLDSPCALCTVHGARRIIYYRGLSTPPPSDVIRPPYSIQILVKLYGVRRIFYYTQTLPGEEVAY